MEDDEFADQRRGERGRIIATVEIQLFENGEMHPAIGSDGSVDLHSYEVVLSIYKKALATLEQQFAGME